MRRCTEEITHSPYSLCLDKSEPERKTAAWEVKTDWALKVMSLTSHIWGVIETYSKTFEKI